LASWGRKAREQEVTAHLSPFSRSLPLALAFASEPITTVAAVVVVVVVVYLPSGEETC